MLASLRATSLRFAFTLIAALFAVPAAYATITITPSTLVSATEGVTYGQVFTAAGGTAPYTFSISSGAPPTGLSLTGTGDDKLSGTPSGSTGQYTFTIKATDAHSATGQITYNLQLSNVTIRTQQQLSTVPTMPYGIHTSVYDQYLTSDMSTYAPLLTDIGIGALRWPGGNYADIYHFSNNSLTPAQTTDSTACADIGAGTLYTNDDLGTFLTDETADLSGLSTIITTNYGSNLADANGDVSANKGGGSYCSNPSGTAAYGTAHSIEAEVAYTNGATTNSLTIGGDGMYQWGKVSDWATYRSYASSNSNCVTNPTTPSLKGLSTNLCVNNSGGFGVKYWEVGNELYGNGYYTSPGWQEDLHDDDYTDSRAGVTSLSPTSYASNAITIVSDMKAVDSTIKAGLVVENPTDTNGSNWDTNVMSTYCNGGANNIDFVSLHYYPGADGAAATTYLPYPQEQIPGIISTLLSDLSTYNCYSSGTTLPQIFVTETGPTKIGDMSGHLDTSNENAFGQFIADVDLTMFENGASNVEWLELHNGTFLTNDGLETPTGAYFGVELAHNIAQPGDSLITTVNDGSVVTHATLRANGHIGVLVSNITSSAVSNLRITINGTSISSGATTTYTLQSNAVTTGSTTVTNSFTISSVPAYSIVEYDITP